MSGRQILFEHPAKFDGIFRWVLQRLPVALKIFDSLGQITTRHLNGERMIPE